jgi:hypothetical protein
LAKSQNPHDPNLVALRKGQNIPNRQAMPRFCASLAVKAQMPPQNQIGGKVAPLEKARLP